MHHSNESYIPEALCTAPDYHLATNIAKVLPKIEPDATKSEYLDSLAAVSAFQFFESIPGIRKTKIPADSNQHFEVWELIPDRILLPEDQEFLKQDNFRLKAIAEKLIWLGKSWLSSKILDQKLPVSSWEDLLEVVSQYDYAFDLIRLVYHPARIVFETLDLESEPTDYWSVYPSRWNIGLTKTRTFNGGFIVDDYNSHYSFSVEVWAGTPFSRNVQTGKLATPESHYLEQG